MKHASSARRSVNSNWVCSYLLPTIEPRMINKSWACSPIYFKHVLLGSVRGGSKNIVVTNIGVCLKWVAVLDLLTWVGHCHCTWCIEFQNCWVSPWWWLVILFSQCPRNHSCELIKFFLCNFRNLSISKGGKLTSCTMALRLVPLALWTRRSVLTVFFLNSISTFYRVILKVS